MLALARFLAALSYLTRIPVRLARPPLADELAELCGYYPAVGVVVGLGGALSGGLLAWLVPGQGLLAGLVCVASWAVLTGGFHLDGLADSFDGLLSGRRGEAAGQIMKDSRVGTMGAVAVFLTLALQAVAAGALLDAGRWGPVVLAAVLGRLWATLAAARGQPPAWAGEHSLGRLLVGRVSVDTVAIAAATALGCGLALSFPFGWLLPAALALLAGALFTALMRRLLDGITGDVLGGGIELAQAAALLGAVLLLP